jgi:hypothetical protein
MQGVSVTFELSRQEFRRSQFGASPQKKSALIVVVLLFVYVLLVAAEVSHDAVLAIVIPSVGAFVLLGVFWIVPRVRWKSGALNKAPRVVTIGDQGIVDGIGSLETVHEWSAILSVRETTEFFVVLLRQGATDIALPKRSLGADDAINLRVLFVTHTTMATEGRMVRSGLIPRLLLLILLVITVMTLYVVIRIHH